MNRLLYPVALVAGLLCGCLLGAGCIVRPTPPVPVPVPPDPGPVDPEPPVPEVQVPRTTFDTVEVGGPAESLSGLPAPERIVTLQDGTEVWSWVLDEPRPEGGWVRWEVHVKDGVILASLPW